MFKNLINEDIFLETYSMTQFTIGFELESWADNIHLKDEFSDFADEYWGEQANIINKKEKKLIDLSSMQMDDDGTIHPDDDGYESSYTCDNCGGDGTIECPECNGDGVIEVACDTCAGTGEIRENGEITDELVDCPDCDGSGNITTECDRCDGRGRITCRDCDGEGYIDYDDNSDERTYEWNSPIFALTPFNLQKIIRFLSQGVKRGMINTNESCGFHVHIGFPNAKTSSEDIFWILCQMVTRNDAEKFQEILKFKNIKLYGRQYANFARYEDLKKEFSFIEEKLEENKFNVETKGKQDKDDLGAYDVDLEVEKYKSYKEEYLTEAKKYKDIINNKELHIWKETLSNIIDYYNSDKYSILRQHPQGTLEWRGARGFMDTGEIKLIKEFFLRKLYPFIKWMNDMLDEKYLEVGNLKIPRNIFDKLLSFKESPATNKNRNRNKKFSRKQDMSIIEKIYKLNPWLTKCTLQDIRFTLDENDNLHMFDGMFKGHFQGISATDCSIISDPNVNYKSQSNNFNNCTFQNSCIINDGRIEYCIIENGKFNNVEVELTTILNGEFTGSDIEGCKRIDGGKFLNCKFLNSYISDGYFDFGFFNNNTVNGNATFKNAKWLRGNWIKGNWIDGFIKELIEYIDSDINPKEFNILRNKVRIMPSIHQRDIDKIPNIKDDEDFDDYLDRVRS